MTRNHAEGAKSASQPTPEQVLSIRPSPELQARVSELLCRSKQGELSQQEEAELERYLTLEHLVRLAKACAWRVRSGDFSRSYALATTDEDKNMP